MSELHFAILKEIRIEMGTFLLVPASSYRNKNLKGELH